MTRIHTLFVWCLLCFLSGKVTSSENTQNPNIPKCSSPQYVFLQKTGIVSCDLEDFFSVIWYNETDFNIGTPTIRLQSNIVSGSGYESKQFGIQPNGSLIIHEVKLKHEQVFKVAYAQSNGDLFDVIEVRVTVLVRPDVPFPLIDQCDKVSDKCYAEVISPIISCSVRDIRPNITLSLLRRTVYGDKDSTNHKLVISGGSGYTHIVNITDVFRYTHLLTVLVCKASNQPKLLKLSESIVLVLNKAADINTIPEYIMIKRDTKMELICANHRIGYGVWKKRSSSNYEDMNLLLYSVLINENFTEIFDDDITVGENISLRIQKTQVYHEGIYLCIFGDGVNDVVSAYNVSVIVPSYPRIQGCNQQQYCVLEGRHGGSLTCSVKGIRPRVHLQWKTEDQGHLISFTNHNLTVAQKGDTFDVSLVSFYHVRESSIRRITVECELVTSMKNLLHASARMDLLFQTGFVQTNQTYNNLVWMITSMVILSLLFIVYGIIIRKKNCKRSSSTSRGEEEKEEEMTSMIGKYQTEKNEISGKKQQFKQHLREKYKDLYEGVQPIPYIRERVHCVQNVFVESGIEYLDLETVANGQWVRLASYQNIFDDSRVQSKRCILEGEPGYGKSIVTLQCAYDWCNSTKSSPLNRVDILILLLLRQLGGVSSIYRAVKQFILPKDSRLTELDIQNILQDAHSVVIILDGYDEYPDQNSSTTDIISIIDRSMFQDFEVVLTTRPFFLPKNYPPLTKRLRLIGFDEKARRHYIRKAVVGDDKTTVCKIEGYLEQNPVLRDLCQVPLLFVIFAHMTYDSDNFRKINSVTSFFRYMISSFHNHMKNKLDEEKIGNYVLFENEHHELDKLAFDALTGKSKTIVWNKNEVCQQLGHDFYDLYIRTGILVEEEIVVIIDEPGTPITDHVQCKEKVRFYHKLFCEWYAAHYFVNCIKKDPNLDLRAFLQHVDPEDMQYFFRFACGMEFSTSKTIIDYVKSIDGGDRFAVLCILEQTGKIESITETIEQICLEGVVINGDDNLLLQRCSLQLLEIAAKNNISIETVALHNCFQSVDISKRAIITSSGLSFSSWIPVRALAVRVLNRKMEESDYISVLKFCSMCPTLKEVVFCGKKPNKVLPVAGSMSSLRSRKVTVIFVEGVGKGYPRYYLNLKNGHWGK